MTGRKVVVALAVGTGVAIATVARGGGGRGSGGVSPAPVMTKAGSSAGNFNPYYNVPWAKLGATQETIDVEKKRTPMPRRSWTSHSSKKESTKDVQQAGEETNESLAELGNVEKPSPAVVEAATKLLRKKQSEETPLDAKRQGEVEEKTATNIAMVRAEENSVNDRNIGISPGEGSEVSPLPESSDNKMIDAAEEQKEEESKPRKPQSLLEVAQNFLKSEEEARLAAEADKEAAKEEEEHATQQKEEQEEHEEKNEIASSEDNVSPKAIEFAKLLLQNEARRVESADWSEAREGTLDRVLGQPTPEILAAARQMLLKAGINLNDAKSFASAESSKSDNSADMNDMTSTLRDNSIMTAQDKKNTIPKRPSVPKLGEDTEEPKAREPSEALESPSQENANNIIEQQQGRGNQPEKQQQPTQGQEKHEMPKKEDVVAAATKEIASNEEEHKEGGEQHQREQQHEQKDQQDGKQQQQQQQEQQQQQQQQERRKMVC